MATVAELRPHSPQAARDHTRDLDAEQSLIGAAFDAAARGVDVVAEVGGPALTDAFAVLEHRELWRLCCRLVQSGAPLRIETVVEAARSSADCPGLRAADLVDWTLRVADWFGAASLARYSAGRIRAAHARRRLVALGEDLALTAKGDPRGLAEWLPDKTAPLLGVHVDEQAKLTLSQEVAAVVTAIEARADGTGPVGIPSGLAGLDRLTGGWHPGHVVVVAGRTGMGKTSFALTVANHALRAAVPVGMLSCEMSRGELLERLLSQCAGVDLGHVKRGYLHGESRRRVHQAAEEIAQWPLQVEDHERSWPAVEIVLRRMAGNGARLLIVDYLGLLGLPGKQPRWEQIGVITGDLKRLAVILQVPILVLCQVNREGVREKDKRPQLWQLRDSGSVEQDADAVVLLHRPALVGDGFDREHAEAILAKHRHGATGTINLRWVGEQARFADGLPDGGGEE